MKNRTTLVLTFCHFSHDLCLGLLPALLPFLRSALDLDYLQAGGLLSALMITSGISQFLGGWLGDRLPRRLLVAAGMAGVGVFTLVAGLTGSYQLLLGIFVLVGLCTGMYHPSGIALLSDSNAPRQRGRAMSLHMVGGSSGYLIAPVVGGLIASAWGWQMAFKLLCIPALFALVLALVYLPKLSTTNPATNPETAAPATVTPWRKLVTVSTMAILIEIVTGAAIAFFALFLVDARGFTDTAATMWLGLLRGGGLLGSLLGGFIADRWGRNRTLLVAFTASGPLLLLLSYLGAAPFLVAMFLFGVFNMMREVCVQVYLMHETPPALRARLIGIYFGFGMEGSSLIQPLVGYVMDSHGVVNVYVWLGIASSAIALAMPGLFYFLIGRSRPADNIYVK